MTSTRWALLAMALLSTGCASLPPQGRVMNLRYTQHEATPPALADVVGAVGGSSIRDAARPVQPSLVQTRQALLGAILHVSGSTRRSTSELSRLEASTAGIAGPPPVFLPFVHKGLEHLRWIDAELAAATRLAHTASEVEDPDMQRALLRLAGPRLQSALLGSLLLAAWVDFLHLADVVLERCPYYSVERLFIRMHRLQRMMEPSMKALASLEPGQVEAAAKDLPALMGHLTGEFHSTREEVRTAAERFEQMLVVKDLLDMLTMASVMKVALPRLVASAVPATLGVGLVAGSDGVMMGTRVVVSAEWVEMMRQLVRAGILSLPAVSAAVRIHAGQVMLAEAHDELPKGVREALGDGPEVRGMRVTDRAGAGMAEPPEHHVLPREFREWFEQRGFTGELSIDQFCVRLEQAHHQAVHGGGNWRLGRMWPGEWNRLIMKVLRKAETETGRVLSRSEILEIVAERMKQYGIPMNFTPWRGK